MTLATLLTVEHTIRCPQCGCCIRCPLMLFLLPEASSVPVQRRDRWLVRRCRIWTRAWRPWSVIVYPSYSVHRRGTWWQEEEWGVVMVLFLMCTRGLHAEDSCSQSCVLAWRLLLGGVRKPKPSKYTALRAGVFVM